MAVKLGDHEYAADMQVVQSFSGTLQNEQVIRVWGDCGLLCRNYVNGLAIGDTVIWGVQECDLSGNGPCGTNFEAAQDYQLSVCGVYWLNYANGLVSGPLFTENVAESLSLPEFQDMVDGCLSTGVEEVGATAPFEVRYVDSSVLLSSNGERTDLELAVYDVQGRVLLLRAWNGQRIALTGLLAGACIVQVFARDERWVRKVLMQ
jgi:hypothetical protein